MPIYIFKHITPYFIWLLNPNEVVAYFIYILILLITWL